VIRDEERKMSFEEKRGWRKVNLVVNDELYFISEKK